MKKIKLGISFLLVSTIFIAGCTEIKASEADITVIEDTKAIMASDFLSSKVDIHEDITGYDWLDDDNIFITKINRNIEPIKIDNEKLKADFEMNNIFLYNTSSKKEQSIGDHTKFQTGALVSPDKKYIFYSNQFEKQSIGYICDINGNIVSKIEDNNIDEYDFSEVRWINDEEIIIPCHKIKGFIIFDTKGNLEKFENIEEGTMCTEDPLNGLAMTEPFKIKDKFYYITLKSGSEKHNKLNIYDIDKGTKKKLIDDEVLEFEVFPDKDNMLITIYNPKKNINELIITDLDGNKKESLAEGSIFGTTISDDGKKIAYIKNDMGKEGVYILDMENKKEYIVASGEYYIPLALSPSGNNIMVHGRKSKENGNPFDEMDITNIIKF